MAGKAEDRRATGQGARHINLLKLCVGADSVDDLATWQAERQAHAGRVAHVTRMWPRREAELLAGGSLYWVIRGAVLVRQRVLGLEPATGADGVPRCAIVLDPELRRTEAQPRRPFQGWRYLAPDDAPRDLPEGRAAEDALPPSLALALEEIGVR